MLSHRFAASCRVALCLLVLIGLPAVAATQAGAGSDGQALQVIVVSHLVQPDGTLMQDAAIIIEDGRIARIAPAAEFANDSSVTHRPGTVASPGLIDIASAAGVLGHTSDETYAIDPSLSVIDAFDALDTSLQGLLEAGVTAVMLSPSNTNLIAGTAATVRTHSPLGADVLNADAALVFSFGPAALRATRAPTSRSGAMAMLRSAFQRATNGQAHPRMQSMIVGDLPSLAICASGEDVANALRLFSTHGLTPMIMHTSNMLDAEEILADAEATVVVGPISQTTATEVLAGIVRLSRNGNPVVFSGGTPLVEGAGLRLAAAMAVRYGMDPAAARRGMTSEAARVAGVADRVGSIEAGRDADFVIFSADPLRPDARVLEVYVQGRRVFSLPPSVLDQLMDDADIDGNDAVLDDGSDDQTSDDGGVS